MVSRPCKSHMVGDRGLLSSHLLDKDQSLSRTRNPHAVDDDRLIYIEGGARLKESMSCLLDVNHMDGQSRYTGGATDRWPGS
jgi:hypothetical protein